MWLDYQKTLLANRDRDTWQLPVISCSGDYLGNVVGQIVEPAQYMIRYFLVYSPQQERRFLLPLDSVIDIDDEIHINVNTEQVLQFPKFSQEIQRDDEIAIYDIISQSPYWINDIDS